MSFTATHLLGYSFIVLLAQFDDGIIVSFIPESTTSALYNYLNECKFEASTMAESFRPFGEKLDCVVKNSFAVSFIYLASCYRGHLRKCCQEWGLLDVGVSVTVKVNDDDKLAWFCSVANDSYRAILDNLNGDLISKYFEPVNQNSAESRIGFSESDVESSFDRACMSFRDNLLLSVEAISCLILRDTALFNVDSLVSSWMKDHGVNSLFGRTASALKFHFPNIKRFVKPYVYGAFMVTLSQKLTYLVGKFVQLLHAQIVSNSKVREIYSSTSLTQLQEDIEVMISTINDGINLVFPSHIVTEESTRHHSKIIPEIRRLEQLKTFFSHSPSSSEVLNVVDQLVAEAESFHTAASDLANMAEACFALKVYADSCIEKNSRRNEKEIEKSDERKQSIFGFFGGSKDHDKESEVDICSHLSGFVAVEILRKIKANEENIAIDTPLSQETFSDVSFWQEGSEYSGINAKHFCGIITMAKENKPVIMNSNAYAGNLKLYGMVSGRARLIVSKFRTLQLPNLGLHFRKAPLQLHCRLGTTEVTTTKVRGGTVTEWPDVIEFDVDDLSALSRRQLSIEIFFKGTLWGSISVGQSIFLLVGLSQSKLTMKAEINFHHSSSSVKSVLKHNGKGELITKSFLEADMAVMFSS